MNYSLIRNFSSADGEGLRTSVYFSGCQRALEGHACPGCHNAVAWEATSGQPWTENEQKAVLDSIEPAYVKGLSILGGEPFSDFNLEGVLALAKACKDRYSDSKDIWLWTGYKLKEEALADSKKASLVNQILKYVDMIVDGPFIQELKNPNLKFRGSSNQHLWKVKHLEKDTWELEDATSQYETVED